MRHSINDSIFESISEEYQIHQMIIELEVREEFERSAQ